MYSIGSQGKSRVMFRIDYDGQWFHEADPIPRKTLTKLLADRGLQVDSQGRYWLTTPYEKHEVEVADVPFVVVDFRIRGIGTPHQAIRLVTNLDEQIMLNDGVHLFLRNNEVEARDIPYVPVRYGLIARLNRSVHADLMNIALDMAGGLSPEELMIHSKGYDHPLGKIPANIAR